MVAFIDQHQFSRCRGRTTRAARCAVVRRVASVRGATARMRFLIRPQAASMELKSCEYGGKKRIVAPACSTSVRTSRAFWGAMTSGVPSHRVDDEVGQGRHDELARDELTV